MMNNDRVFSGAIAAVVLVLLTSLAGGCGYSSQTMLPEHVRSVYVGEVKNDIDITTEVTTRSAFKVYRPGLETELRNALIERFVFDGHLRVADRESADSELWVHLIEFKRDPMRYHNDESVREFRVSVVAEIVLIDRTNDEILWKAERIGGTGDYLLSGELAKTEDEAVAEALEDLSRHVVENILEQWS